MNNRLTRHSRSGKHALRSRNRKKRSVARSLVENVYLLFSNTGHGRKFKQMHLCTDFNAGPSKELPLFFFLCNSSHASNTRACSFSVTAMATRPRAATTQDGAIPSRERAKSRLRAASMSVSERTSMYSPGRTSELSDCNRKPWVAVGAWFLGPKAENADLFRHLILKAVDSQVNFRKNFFPCDPVYVTDEMKNEATYKHTVEDMKRELSNMQRDLERCVPFFSVRYKVKLRNLL